MIKYRKNVKKVQHVEKWCPGRSWGVTGAQDAQKVQKKSQKLDSLLPFGELFGHLFGIFLCRASGTVKKGVWEGHSKLDSFFGRFWALPGGPQEGSRPDGSAIFTFASGHKKGSKMGAKMECFELPMRTIREIGAQEAASEIWWYFDCLGRPWGRAVYH